MTSTRHLATIVIAIGAGILITGCGGSAKQNAAVRAERLAAIHRAEHPSFPVAPCSLLTPRQVSHALGVRVTAQTSRSGCVYSGTAAGGDRRTATVTPGTLPASGSLISPAVSHPVALSGAGYHARAGVGTNPGSVMAPATAVAGLMAGHIYVALLVQDANPNASSQLRRAVTLIGQIGDHLVRSCGAGHHCS